jgi:hypothetical protein
MNEDQLLERITVNPEIFGGKPIIRGRRLAVEHVLACSLPATILKRSSKVIPGWSGPISKLALSMLAVTWAMNASNR